MTVLVLTEPTDVTTDLVVLALQKRHVKVHRIDTGDFPQRLALTAIIGGEHPRWSGALRPCFEVGSACR
jgi:hypothetical protein